MCFSVCVCVCMSSQAPKSRKEIMNELVAKSKQMKVSRELTVNQAVVCVCVCVFTLGVPV